jgi:predicted transcriptional regulator
MTKQQQARMAGTGTESRPDMAAEGTKVRLDDDTVGRVLDASRRQGTDPRVLMEEAVREALGDREDRQAQISVEGFRHSGDGGRVSLGMPTTRVLKRAARQRGESVNNLVRGAISQAADSVRRADEQKRQSPEGAGTLPFFDPLGVVEAATDGLLADPVGRMIRGPATTPPGAAGGRRGR